MRAGSSRPLDFLALPADTVLNNTIELIYQRYPKLITLLGVVAPFRLLAYALHRKFWRLLRIFAFVQKLKAYFECSVSIPSSEPMLKMVKSWLAENLKITTRSMSLQTFSHGCFSSANVPLKFVPNAESTSFRFNGRTFHVSNGPQTVRQNYDQHEQDGQDDQGGQDEQDYPDYQPRSNHVGNQHSGMRISYITFGSKSVARIQEFLNHVRFQAVKSTGEAQTMFYRVETDGTWWAQPTRKPSRSMETVAMQRHVKDGLIKDVATYVAEGSKKWYASMGIPHRRGYLLFRPPGCGKSSVINAIARDFDLSVFSITLSSPELTDDSLEGLFRSLPERALVLLEDVDASGIESRAPRNNNKPNKKSGKSKAKTGITLSGLLNCIDGACSVEHRVLFVTSNTPNSLDPALVRPGRIDMKILLANANRDVMQQQFAHIFADIPGLITFSLEFDNPKLSEAFAANVPEDQIIPAEIQVYLLRHYICPANAAKNAKDWADTIIERGLCHISILQEVLSASNEHYNTVLWLIDYLVGSLALGMKYRGNSSSGHELNFSGYVDASWADDIRGCTMLTAQMTLHLDEWWFEGQKERQLLQKSDVSGKLA